MSVALRPVELSPSPTLSRIDETVPLTSTSATSGAESTNGLDSFGAVLGSALDQANRLDLEAGRKTEALAAGTIDDIHGTMISVKEADIALKLVGTVRTKILDAFQELWRTSV